MPDSPPPSPERRRLLLALGYGAVNAAALGRLLTRGHGSSTPAATRHVAAAGPVTAPAVHQAAAEPPDDHTYDVVISGGRVIDPDTGYDRLANVGIDGGTVTAIKTVALKAKRSIDATGRVVAPGFIDILSYDPADLGATYKIGDGVTTNLGMHGIQSKAKDFFARFTDRCLVNFGGAFSDPWHRANVLGLNITQAASPDQISRLAAMCEQELHDGWIGVDFEPEYTPGVDFAEIKALATVAARYDVPCTFHGRYSAYGTNDKTLDEIIEVAKQTGARVHVEHIISTGGTFDMARSLQKLQTTRDQGHKITACMYPYNFWATYLGSARFNPGWQERFRISYGDLQVAGDASGARLTSATFRQYQRQNKLVAAYAIPEDDVKTCLRDPHVMIGSDAILTNGNNHPRATGCFARTLGKYVREDKVVSLGDALAKMTILPARWLEPKAPAMAKKGRLQRGADADITVFDPATVLDKSTVPDPKQFSAGIDWVLIAGNVMKTPQGVVTDAKPGKPIVSQLV
ncbi:MAG: dihydroorotase-like cyclic amidohydrolase [Acidimicrobiales bacterium]|nr:dihydroorotase-like cyclic amidohydrolase [Acidimicrobiales bacterium]